MTGYKAIENAAVVDSSVAVDNDLSEYKKTL